MRWSPSQRGVKPLAVVSYADLHDHMKPVALVAEVCVCKTSRGDGKQQMQAIHLYRVTRKYSQSRTQILYLSSSIPIPWNSLLTCLGSVFSHIASFVKLLVWFKAELPSQRQSADGDWITWSRWGVKIIPPGFGFLSMDVK